MTVFTAVVVVKVMSGMWITTILELAAPILRNTVSSLKMRLGYIECQMHRLRMRLNYTE